MSEVNRWKLKGFIPGIEGETKAVFQPTVVLADDYDAALAREAALREELYQAKEARDAEMLNGVRTQQRLTVAERLLQRVIDSSVLSFEQDAPEELESLEADICASLNPAAEGEGS